MSAVEARALVKVYASGTRAVDGLDLDIRPGEILGLLVPTAGSVTVAGFDASRERLRALRQIGAVLEGARNVYWRLPVAENLRYFGSLRLRRGPALARRIDELLGRFDLESRGHEPVGRLSRGMQQKVALAIALVADPSVLLLDEPPLVSRHHGGASARSHYQGAGRRGEGDPPDDAPAGPRRAPV